MKVSSFVQNYRNLLDQKHLIWAIDNRICKAQSSAHAAIFERNYTAKSQANLISAAPEETRLNTSILFDAVLRGHAPARSYIEHYERELFGTKQHLWALVGWYCIKHICTAQAEADLSGFFFAVKDLVTAWPDRVQGEVELLNYAMVIAKHSHMNKASAAEFQRALYLAIWHQPTLLKMIQFEQLYRNLKIKILTKKH